MSKKTMLSLGEIVHTENGRAKNTKLERRAHRSGKLRAVPAILLSSLLLVTGAAGAQATTDTENSVASSEKNNNKVATNHLVSGTVGISMFRTKFTLKLVDNNSSTHVFDGLSAGGTVTGSVKITGTVETTNLQDLISDTRYFQHTQGGRGVVIFNFLSESGKKLGSLLTDRIPLLPDMGRGVGKWGTI